MSARLVWWNQSHKIAIIVFFKEVSDNLRDHRSLFTALLLGPLLGPILIVAMINLSIERSVDSVERKIDVPVIGAEQAQNLISYLQSRNIEVIDGPQNRQAALAAVATVPVSAEQHAHGRQDDGRWRARTVLNLRRMVHE